MNPKVNPLFAKLAAAEQSFFESQFLSPVVDGQPVRVKIANIVHTMEISPKKFRGWGIFRCIDQKRAKLVKGATLIQKQQYLKLYPRFSLIVTRQGDKAAGIPAHLTKKDFNVKANGQIPIFLAEEVRLFDTVNVAFDGERCWYDSHSRHRSPKFALQLRESLLAETLPEKMEIAGSSAEERMAYAVAFSFEIEAKKDRKEERLRKALERGGATLRSYIDRGTTYTVEYAVEGETFRSVINADTLRVASAGICLNGGDNSFDLQSLIGVMKEGQNRHLINRVGIRE